MKNHKFRQCVDAPEVCRICQHDIMEHATESEQWCEQCNNTGEVECYCGGDLCVCDRNGTYPCPHCGNV